jgi:hypothetical protein
MKKNLQLILLLCLFNITFAQTNTQPSKTEEPRIDYIAERNFQLILKELSQKGDINQDVFESVKNAYRDNTLSQEYRTKILISYIEDSDYKTWPQDIKDFGLFLLTKYEKENTAVVPFYKQGRKPTIRQIGTLMNKAIPELDPASGAVLTLNQQIQLVRERMPSLMTQ